MKELWAIMRIDILTLFPEMFKGPFSESIIKRALEKKLVNINLHNIRDWADEKHRRADDAPYGGGPGMVMKVDVLHRALSAVIKKTTPQKRSVKKILLSPQGKPLTQAKVQELLNFKRLIFVCGHYEGVDQRFNDYIDEEISIGDYVLTGGELPAMVITDALVRLIPGVVGTYESVVNESFSKKMLDYPHYTRPVVYDGKEVPQILLSGHEKNIRIWRQQQAEKITLQNRPDLIEQ